MKQATTVHAGNSLRTYLCDGLTGRPAAGADLQGVPAIGAMQAESSVQQSANGLLGELYLSLSTQLLGVL